MRTGSLYQGRDPKVFLGRVEYLVARTLECYCLEEPVSTPGLLERLGVKSVITVDHIPYLDWIFSLLLP
jgi:hypothetical protein